MPAQNVDTNSSSSSRCATNRSRNARSARKAGLKRLVGGGAGLIFKGTGFYITDYKNKSGSKDGGGDKKSSESKSSGSDSKPASTSSAPAKSSSESGKK
jgi:Uncharacterized protein conserved in bacteria